MPWGILPSRIPIYFHQCLAGIFARDIFDDISCYIKLRTGFIRHLHLNSTYRVSDLEAGAGLESGEDLSIQAGGVEGQSQLLWNFMQLQLHLGADLLLRGQPEVTI